MAFSGGSKLNTEPVPPPRLVSVRFPGLAVRIDLYVDRLARPHVLKLSLFEVGSHPDIIQRDDIHQFLSDAYVLADFRGLLPDNSGHRRANHGIAQVQFSLIQLGLALFYLGVAGVGLGSSDGNLFWGSLALRRSAFACKSFPSASRRVCASL